MRSDAVQEWMDAQEAYETAANGLKWEPVDTYPNDDSVVLVGNPDSGTLPVIAWKIQNTWFAYDPVKRQPLHPQPTIWMNWIKMPKAVAS